MFFSFFPFNNCILARFSVSSPLLNMAFKMTSPFDVPELNLVGRGEIFFFSLKLTFEELKQLDFDFLFHYATSVTKFH